MDNKAERKIDLEIMLENWIADGDAEWEGVDPAKIRGPEWDEDESDWVYYYDDEDNSYMICDDGTGFLHIVYLGSLR